MSELLGAARLRQLIARHGVRPTKTLGQNFVIDPNTIRKMIQLAGITPGDNVLEVGAGAGSLTLGLLEAGASVAAIEVDPRLVGVLDELFEEDDRVEVIQADATRFDLSSTDAAHLVGNLPYNAAALIVLRALQEAPAIQHLTVMTQREVGERLAARPGSKVYGQTSVLVAYHGPARVVARISRNAFHPVPGVDSVVVRVDRRAEQPAVAQADFIPVVRAAFAQRRKTLRRALDAAVPEGIDAVFEESGVDPHARAEELDLDAFVALSQAVSARSPGRHR